MKSRREFSEALATVDLTHAERAVAFLWYYRKSGEFEDRTNIELASDLSEEGFARPHVTQLETKLRRSRDTVPGSRPKSFRVNLTRLAELDERYGSLLEAAEVEIVDEVLPSEWVAGTRGYLEDLVRQINGTYQFGFYDACAVLCRRLMESLIIDVYIARGWHQEIQREGVFFMLDALIAHITADRRIVLGRNIGRSMREIKDLGDAAAHDRTYITHETDVRQKRTEIRRVIRTLLEQAQISV